ncbi:MAG: LptF/LptG family permease [Bacteroidetes bacterium]|nr:LptF/LptG family permease [Bacteroidota bacterium]
MRKLDWYILKKFLVTFFYCLLLFTVIAVAVDSSEKADDFVAAKLSTSGIIREYYLGFVPWIWSLLFPLFVFIAVIFFTSKMASRSEIIAILASGTSYNRFLRPFFAGGLLLAGLLWVASRYWIPKANVIKSNFQTKYMDKKDPGKFDDGTNCRTCYYKRIDTSTFIGLKDFDTASKSARNFFMEKVKDNKVVYNLRAETMRWDTAIKKWSLTNVVERHVDSLGERIKYSPSLILSLNMKPIDFRRDYYLKDKLTTPELVEFIRKEEARGTEGLNTYKVEMYRRTATPAAVLLLTFIGVVIASRRTRGGSGVHLALGFVIAAMFIISDRFSTVFATKGNFSPMIAAWLPNIVFTLVALYLYRKTPK